MAGNKKGPKGPKRPVRNAGSATAANNAKQTKKTNSFYTTSSDGLDVKRSTTTVFSPGFPSKSGRGNYLPVIGSTRPSKTRYR